MTVGPLTRPNDPGGGLVTADPDEIPRSADGDDRQPQRTGAASGTAGFFGATGPSRR